jgi:hypothetical protein
VRRLDQAKLLIVAFQADVGLSIYDLRPHCLLQLLEGADLNLQDPLTGNAALR